MKKILFIISFLLFLILPIGLRAQTASQVNIKNNTNQMINSFELFWPISAGKTIGDSFYWLKNLKEDLRALLIFGDLEKADYYTFLSVKRIVEAEKLIKEKNLESVNKTLDNSIKNLDKVDFFINKYSDNLEDNGGIVAEQMKTRLSNLEIFIPQLTLVSEESSKILLEKNLEKIQLILSKI